MNVEIDTSSGFCFGVIKAIDKAEFELKKGGNLYCIGEIVHNETEVKRLEDLGLITINYEKYKKLKDCIVLIRAHGEPPETYQIAIRNNITLIDATCPVVLKLQEKIKANYKEIEEEDGQIVIYGKDGHPEVEGLNGQISNKAIIINDVKDLKKIDFKKPIRLFSQTTMSKSRFDEIKETIKQKIRKAQNNSLINFDSRNTVCGQVSCREPKIIEFTKKHDVILFVSGKNSSNGKMLYEICHNNNSNSFFINSPGEVKSKWLNKIKSVGICGATSTPLWLMQQVAERVTQLSE